MLFGEHIKLLRNNRGLTQQELAQAVGVSDKAVSTWENNTKMPRMGTVEKLAEFFKIPKAELLGWEDGASNTSNTTNLSPETDKYISLMESLNDLGKKKAVEYVTDLSFNPKYKKETHTGYIAAFGGGTKTVEYSKQELEDAKKAIDAFRYISMTEDKKEQN